MKFITVSDLSHKSTIIVSEIESTGEEVIITKKGKPSILMSLISNSDFALKEKGNKEGLRRIKDSERIKHLVELARPFKNDQTETGKLAKKILSGYRSLVKSEKKLKVAEKKYKELKKKGGEKNG